MTLLCLKCASRKCTCGRLALARLVRELGDDADATPQSGLASISSAVERPEAAAELDGLLVLKLRYGKGMVRTMFDDDC